MNYALVVPLAISTAVLAVLVVALILALGKCATDLENERKRVGWALDDRDQAIRGRDLVKGELRRCIFRLNAARKRSEVLETAAAAWMLETQRLKRLVRFDVDAVSGPDAFHRLFSDRTPPA